MMRIGRFDLRNLKQRDIAIIFIVLTTLVAVAWFFYLYRPTQETIQGLEDEISRLDIEITRGEQARQNLPTLRLAVAELEQDRRDFLAQLPREEEVAALLDQLRVSGGNADVTINSISRGNATDPIQGVRPIGFTVATSGNFTSSMSFLETLEDLRRFTKIRQVGLSVADNSSTDPDLNATYSFIVYVFTGEDPGEQSQ